MRMSILGKHWTLAYERPKGESLWTALTKSRAIENPGQFFSSASVDDLHDPFLFPDMQKAVDRIQRAIAARERVIVYGDYDVDGTSGSAILIHILRFLGAEVSYRIPHRIEDGYGLHNKYIDQCAEAGVSLLITVDCGISCAKEVEYGKQKKVDVIITDHHHIPEQKPEAFALLHPELAPDYPFKHLAGSAVAFKLGCALLIASDNEDLIPGFVDLASLGTVADCVPLLGENRAIVKLGLKQMEQTKWNGLDCLIRQSGAQAPFSSDTIGFQIGPRINASGRIDNPYWALKALIEEGESARQNSLKLEELNQMRRELTKQAQQEAEEGLDINAPLLITKGPWSSGVVGLIAGRLQEAHSKPAFIIQDRGKILVGSARSLPGFHCVHALNQVKDLLVGYGGHEQAAGFSLLSENYAAFVQELQAYAQKQFAENPIQATLHADLHLQAEDFSIEAIQKMEAFAPFGIGNPRPLFWVKDAKVTEVRPVGSTREHLKFTVEIEGSEHSGIAFRFAQHEAKLWAATDLLVSMELNEWQGTVTPQLKLVDAA